MQARGESSPYFTHQSKMYTALHGSPPDSSRRCYAAALLALAALGLWLFVGTRPSSSSFRSTCELWSCDQPLIRSAAGRWPAPRPELDGSAAERWHRLHATHVREAQHARSSRLVFLGDSITEG